ncbi:chain length determinant protein EpsF [Rhodocyclus tenuis]|uniref:Chain length determinant protein EpsF n=1 Tax=Rhodocyclus gracilis TaxID=2929842 RepID=A0ABX0WG89_9RHOO|nr:chain length determinant protein EpsF [Rhodocyclus gracilis]NJA88736.1 chain length determinant protein EpsF [Rhodocyclus gracilis]
MTLQQFLLILRARARIILYTLLGVVALTLIVSLLLPKQYTASTAVVLDVKSPDPVAGMVLPGLMAPGYMATQVDIVNSDRVAQRVVKLLHMDENPKIRAQWQEATEGRGDLVSWLGELLQKKLNVKPSRESNVINISFSGSDPAFAAAVTNAFAQAFIDVSLELKVEPARQYSTWFDEQTKLQRSKLEAAQAALSAYQQKTGIVATDERLDYETAKLNELSSQLTNVQAQTSDSHSKQKSAGGSETLTEVIQNPLINNLKSDIARLEAKQQESSINLGKNHPQTVRNASEIVSLKERLAVETSKISGSLSTSYQVGKQKEKELLEAIDAQKARLLDISQQRDAINVLKRDVETAQRAFEAVSQRASQTRLESQSVQTNLAVLNPAIEPPEASSPKLLLNLILSVFIGTLLGVGAALALELGNRRIRSAADLSDAIKLPLLASIGSTHAPPTLRETLLSFFAWRKRPLALAR